MGGGEVGDGAEKVLIFWWAVHIKKGTASQQLAALARKPPMRTLVSYDLKTFRKETVRLSIQTFNLWNAKAIQYGLFGLLKP